MITSRPPATDPAAAALRRITQRGVVVEPWLASGQQPDAPPTRPTLYLVDQDVPPPTTWGPLEDWVRLPAEPRELEARGDALMLRAEALGALPVTVDDADLLHVGGRWVDLSQLDARLVRALLACEGQVLERDDAVAALWPEGPPSDERALDNRLKHLRARLADLPITIHTVRGRGLLLERRRAPRA